VGYGVDDLTAKAMQPFAVPFVELGVRAVALGEWWPNQGSQRRGDRHIVRRLGVPLTSHPDAIGQISCRFPIVHAKRVEKAPNHAGNFVGGGPGQILNLLLFGSAESSQSRIQSNGAIGRPD
jgi:hypothetical protein